MKVSKSLLSAIAVGIVMSTTSCSLQDEVAELHDEDCPVGCDVDHEQEAEEEERCWDCPACGMG